MSSQTPDRAQLRQKSPVPRLTLVKRLCWSAVQCTLYRYSFHNWYAWRALLLRLFGAQLGRGCRFRRTSRVFYPWLLTVGDLAIVGDEAQLYNLGHLTIGHRVMISQEAYICGGTHDYTDPALPLVTCRVTIGDDAWICVRAFVGPGVTVGAGAIVGACAVAVKDVPPWMIVGGNPAKPLKARLPFHTPQ